MNIEQMIERFDETTIERIAAELEKFSEAPEMVSAADKCGMKRVAVARAKAQYYRAESKVNYCEGDVTKAEAILAVALASKNPIAIGVATERVAAAISALASANSALAIAANAVTSAESALAQCEHS